MTFRRSTESQRWILAVAAALPLLTAVYAVLVATSAPPPVPTDEPLRVSQQLIGQPPIAGALLVLLALWAAAGIVREASAEVSIDDEGIAVRYGLRPVRIRWAEVVLVDYKLRSMTYVVVGGRGERIEVNLVWLPADRREALLSALCEHTREVWDRQRRDIQEYGIRQGRDALHWVFLRFTAAVTAVAVLYMLLNERSKGGHYQNLVYPLVAMAAGWALVAGGIGLFAGWPLEFTADSIIERRPLRPRVCSLAALTHIVIERTWLPAGSLERLYLIGDGPRIIVPSGLVWYPLIREHVLARATAAEVLVLGDAREDGFERMVVGAAAPA